MRYKWFSIIMDRIVLMFMEWIIFCVEEYLNLIFLGNGWMEQMINFKIKYIY